MELIVDNGKVLEPSLVKKIKATMMNDNTATIILPFSEVQGIIGNEIYNDSKWLNNYKTFRLEYDKKSNSFSLIFFK